MTGFVEEYRRSLKMSEAEEVFDVLFYRPFAFLFVKTVYRTPLTPNQVTLLSLLCGCIGAYEYSDGIMPALAWGSAWYAVANILDCADGQLARLQKSGTLFGRLIDGIADYLSSLAIFLGLGFGLAATGHSAWWLVAGGIVSTAVHAMFFDHYQSEYISAVRGERNFLERESEQFGNELGRLRESGREPMKSVILSFYVRYLELQRRSSTKEEMHIPDPQKYRRDNLRMIRAWSFLGPTTNRTLLIVCALFSRVDLYLWIIVVAGNMWLGICYAAQRRIHQAGTLVASNGHPFSQD
jgi:hypothetical protein